MGHPKATLLPEASLASTDRKQRNYCLDHLFAANVSSGMLTMKPEISLCWEFNKLVRKQEIIKNGNHYIYKLPPTFRIENSFQP